MRPSKLYLPYTVFVDHLHLVVSRSNHQPFRYFVYASFESGQPFFERSLWIMVSGIWYISVSAKIQIR